MLSYNYREFVARLMNPMAELIEEIIHTDTVDHVRIDTLSMSIGNSIVGYKTQVTDLNANGAGTSDLYKPATAQEAESTHQKTVEDFKDYFGQQDIDSHIGPTDR